MPDLDLIFLKIRLFQIKRKFEKIKLMNKEIYFGYSYKKKLKQCNSFPYLEKNEKGKTDVFKLNYHTKK